MCLVFVILEGGTFLSPIQHPQIFSLRSAGIGPLVDKVSYKVGFPNFQILRLPP